MKTTLKILILAIAMTSCGTKKSAREFSKTELEAVELTSTKAVRESDVTIEKQNGISAYMLTDNSQINLTQGKPESVIELTDQNGNVLKVKGANFSISQTKQTSIMEDTTRTKEVAKVNEKVKKTTDTKIEAEKKKRSRSTEAVRVSWAVVMGIVLLGAIIFVIISSKKKPLV